MRTVAMIGCRGIPKETSVMRRILCVSFVVSGVLSGALPAVGQAPVGALAIDERQGDQWGWAVDYETAAAAQERALGECGAGCSVVLTFGRCAAYAADRDADSTAFGWAEAYASADAARRAALSECSARGGGSGCVVRAWGCNGPVVEEGLGLDRASRRQIQLGLRAGGFDPGGADGLFGPRTRGAIRNWQTSRGGRATGYLDGSAAEALRSAGAAGAGVAQVVARPGPSAAEAVQQAPPAAPAASPPASAEQENLFWQSIMNSTNAAEFEAYLSQFPNGVFSALARARLSALQSPAGTARRQPGEVFRDCAECPEMVVLPGGRLALGRYEVTVGEYRAFASATGGGAGGGCLGRADSWRNPGFRQTDRHPVACVSWDDAQEYVSWLSRTTGARYRLPSEEEWGRAAAGSQPGCDPVGRGTRPDGTCPVGSYGANGAGLSDMVGNLWEWTADCWEGDCGRRVVRGGSWFSGADYLRPGARNRLLAGLRDDGIGFRVARTLD